MDINKKYTRRQVLDLGAKVLTSASLAGFVDIDLSKPGHLFTIHLSGGNDALNTVVPYSDRNYYRARKSLSIKKDDVVKLDERYGLHPSLGSLKPLFRLGQLAVVLGVGYSDQSMSHELSASIVKNGIIESTSPNFRHKESKPEKLGLLKQSSVSLPFKTEHIELDGFDTHIDQLVPHANALKNFADVVLDLRGKHKGDCLIYAYSEFGRAIFPNEDRGFDHGTAGLSMLIGPSVKGGIYGGYGNLNKKPGEDYIDMVFDFRSILAEIV